MSSKSVPKVLRESSSYAVRDNGKGFTKEGWNFGQIQWKVGFLTEIN
jgi:hypothetical protein